ncbi:hypothetical protein CYMTET_25048 [Cymbomonas tetramitiformis]|uniref:Uncharacterized protein n=1 Tax=Cymbomonas tetramitiformis TaxID=36881 RepID=A0AAE0FUN3_9CHLO|nr:hypothetical protein CYMTET_25048 [Cymbomonas tetramitiformis]
MKRHRSQQKQQVMKEVGVTPPYVNWKSITKQRSSRARPKPFRGPDKSGTVTASSSRASPVPPSSVQSGAVSVTAHLAIIKSAQLPSDLTGDVTGAEILNERSIFTRTALRNGKVRGSAYGAQWRRHVASTLKAASCAKAPGTATRAQLVPRTPRIIRVVVGQAANTAGAASPSLETPRNPPCKNGALEPAEPVACEPKPAVHSTRTFRERHPRVGLGATRAPLSPDVVDLRHDLSTGLFEDCPRKTTAKRSSQRVPAPPAEPTKRGRPPAATHTAEPTKRGRPPAATHTAEPIKRGRPPAATRTAEPTKRGRPPAATHTPPPKRRRSARNAHPRQEEPDRPQGSKATRHVARSLGAALDEAGIEADCGHPPKVHRGAHLGQGEALLTPGRAEAAAEAADTGEFLSVNSGEAAAGLETVTLEVPGLLSGQDRSALTEHKPPEGRDPADVLQEARDAWGVCDVTPLECSQAIAAGRASEACASFTASLLMADDDPMPLTHDAHRDGGRQGLDAQQGAHLQQGVDAQSCEAMQRGEGLQQLVDVHQGVDLQHGVNLHQGLALPRSVDLQQSVELQKEAEVAHSRDRPEASAAPAKQATWNFLGGRGRKGRSQKSRATASVSYVAHTESKQHGAVASAAPLPHMVYRPPDMQRTDSTDPRIASCVDQVMLKDSVLTVRMNACHDITMKEYLQKDADRGSMVHHRGSELLSISGLQDLHTLIRDKSFICLHFMYDEASLLRPCTCPHISAPHTGGPLQCDCKRGAALHGSDVQLGFLIRKGVGGTSKMQRYAKLQLAPITTWAHPPRAPESHKPHKPYSLPEQTVSPPITLPTPVAPSSTPITSSSPVEAAVAVQGAREAPQFDEESMVNILLPEAPSSAGPPAPSSAEASVGLGGGAGIEMGKAGDGNAEDGMEAALREMMDGLMNMLAAPVESAPEIPHLPQADTAAAEGFFGATVAAGGEAAPGECAETGGIASGDELIHPAAGDPPCHREDAVGGACEGGQASSRGHDRGQSAETIHPGAQPRVKGDSAMDEDDAEDDAEEGEEDGEEDTEELWADLEPSRYSLRKRRRASEDPEWDPEDDDDEEAPDDFELEYDPELELEEEPEPEPEPEPDLPVEQKFYTISLRMELYVRQALWETLPAREQCALFSAARRAEERLQELVEEWNRARGAVVAGEEVSAAPVWPYYLIGTRDSFTHHLQVKSTEVKVGERSFTKLEYFFRPGECPPKYHQVVGTVNEEPPYGLPVGITCYPDIFSNEELSQMEAASDELMGKARSGRLHAESFHQSGSRDRVKRTKFFFGARYLWTREQLEDRDASKAAGVRVDVPEPPSWFRRQVEEPLVKVGVVQPDFINSYALNVYHDGSEGLGSHYDDAHRFNRPITSLRLFSDARLAFGAQLYGGTNGAFAIPLPRGCVTVMEHGSYAANGIKHSIRAGDMRGKSASMIIRQIHPKVMEAAQQLLEDEVCEYLEGFNLKANAPPYSLLRKMRQEKEAVELMDTLERGVCAKVMHRMIRVLETEQKREHVVGTTCARVVEGMVKHLEQAEKRQDLAARTEHRRKKACEAVISSMIRRLERAEQAHLKAQQDWRCARGRPADGVMRQCQAVLNRVITKVETLCGERPERIKPPQDPATVYANKIERQCNSVLQRVITKVQMVFGEIPTAAAGRQAKLNGIVAGAARLDAVVPSASQVKVQGRRIEKVCCGVVEKLILDLERRESRSVKKAQTQARKREREEAHKQAMQAKKLLLGQNSDVLKSREMKKPKIEPAQEGCTLPCGNQLIALSGYGSMAPECGESKFLDCGAGAARLAGPVQWSPGMVGESAKAGSHSRAAGMPKQLERCDNISFGIASSSTQPRDVPYHQCQYPHPVPYHQYQYPHPQIAMQQQLLMHNLWFGQTQPEQMQ